MRRELAAAAAVVIATAAVAAFVAALGGLGLVYNDEYIYAAAARELAQGRTPWCYGPWPFFVARLGFPYTEIHARGSIATIALAFRLFGTSETAIFVPSFVETLLAALAVHLTARLAGVGPWRSALVGSLAGAHPILATFAASAFPEAGHTLGFALAGASIAARAGRLRAILLVTGTVVAVVHRETALALPVAAGLGFFVRARAEGASRKDALRASLVAPLAALVAGLGAFALFRGPMLDPGVRWWYVLQAAMPEGESLYNVVDTRPAPMNSWMIALRAARMTRAFFLGGDELEGTRAIVAFVHAGALSAALVAWRSRSATARALAVSALALYFVKGVSSILFHEPPGLFARHIGSEGVACFVAAAVALARSKRPWLALALAAITLASSLVVSGVIARGHGERLVKQRRVSARLQELLPPTDGVLCAEIAWRLCWDRPGQFVLLPPFDEETLVWLAARVPIDRLALDTGEPLVARPLALTHRRPQRIAGFDLAHIDSSLGVTILIYEKRR